MNTPRTCLASILSLACCCTTAAAQQFVVTLEERIHEEELGFTSAHRLASSGDWTAVSDPFHGGSSTRVWIYRRAQGAWQLHQELANPATGSFGLGLALDAAAGRLAVGAGSSVHLYELAGGRFQLVETLPNLCNDAPQAGYSLALAGDVLAVGNPSCSVTSDGNEGKVYVYRRSGGSWALEQTLDGSQGFGSFGQSVALTGEHLLVGEANPLSDWPRTYGFRHQAGVWSSTGHVTGSAANYGPQVAAEDDRLVTIGRDASFPFGLRAYVCEWNGAGWVQVAGLGEVPARRDVALDSGLALFAVGGETLLFEEVGGSWIPRGSIQGVGGGQVAVSRPFVLVGDLELDGTVDAFLAGLEWSAYCAGDGSASACPCGNEAGGGSGTGCVNSTGVGALLDASGSTSLVADDLALQASGLPPGRPTLFFAGGAAVAGGAGLPLGDGLRCAGGNVRRLALTAADAGGVASIGPGLGGLPGWDAGTLQHVQAWYRDPVGGPCGANSNLTNGLRLVLTP